MHGKEKRNYKSTYFIVPTTSNDKDSETRSTAAQAACIPTSPYVFPILPLFDCVSYIYSLALYASPWQTYAASHPCPRIPWSSSTFIAPSSIFIFTTSRLHFLFGIHIYVTSRFRKPNLLFDSDKFNGKQTNTIKAINKRSLDSRIGKEKKRKRNNLSFPSFSRESDSWVFSFSTLNNFT